MDDTTLRLRVDNEHAVNVCKMGQGHDCCRYLTMGADGWSCQKHGHFRIYLDRRVSEGTIGSRGDNCPGRAE